MNIILLHGSLGSPWNFNPLIRELQAQGHHTYAVGYGGMGLRHINQCVEEVRHKINRLAIDTSQAAVIGHSLGGMVAARVAETMPFAQIIGLGACWFGLPPLRFTRRDLCDPRFFPDLSAIDCPLLSVVSTGDTIVPAYSSILPDCYGRNYWVFGVPHSRLPRLKEVASLVSS